MSVLFPLERGGKKRKACIVSLLAGLIFTETLLKLCLVYRCRFCLFACFFYYYYYGSLLLCTEKKCSRELGSMCSLEMNISAPFILLTASFSVRSYPADAFCWPWLWVQHWKYKRCLRQVSYWSASCRICGGNPALHDNRQSPLQNPY